MLASVKIHGR